VVFPVVFLLAVPCARAQQGPHIGYVYPAGARRGAAIEVSVGGQYLRGTTGAYISGKGVEARLIGYTGSLAGQQLGELSRKLRQLEAQYNRIPVGRRTGGNSHESLVVDGFRNFARRLGVTNMDPKTFIALRKRLTDPKRQPNAQIAEAVTLKVTVADDAELGRRELRLKTSSGVSNPLVLHIGQCTEYLESEPNNKTPDSGVPKSLPVIINGQIMPGDVDRFQFTARKGMHLIAAVSARELIPYLADAVPGWFQASLKLSDAGGNKVAYNDDFRFHPDPVIYYEVPADGQYILEIKDAIFRGREDFVYRIALGELPFVTSVFPLGGPAGAKTKVKLKGWNLPADVLTVDAGKKGSGILPISLCKDQPAYNRISFALDTLPECLEKEPNNEPRTAQRLKLPIIVNGRIDRVGDRDVFSFTGRAGDEITAEVLARRLESPLDSLLKITRSDGKMVAVNDDHEDRGAGLITHQADSRIIVKLPGDGTYLVHLGDTQNKGGAAYGYRLRISPRRPDFELRVVPSGVNATSGMTIPVTVYALRKDGFSGEIALELKGVPQSFVLGGGNVPAGQDRIQLTLTVSRIPREEPLNMHLVGSAVIGGRKVSRRAVPAEDMMQAFLYRHLVPSTDWIVAITGERRSRINFSVLGDGPVRLVPGRTGLVRIAGPQGLLAMKLKLELSDPPKGIAITKVLPDQRGFVVELSADSEDAKPGLKGNLIAIGSVEVTSRYSSGGKRRIIRRRISLGALPAIPFEILPTPATAPATKPAKP